MRNIMKVLTILFHKVSGAHSWIYVSGPMTGLRQHNFPAFNRATKKLRSKGYKVVNPAELDNDEWTECLRRDLIIMLFCCDKVAVLPDWKKSKGALLEVEVAKRLYMPVHKIGYWLRRKP